MLRQMLKMFYVENILVCHRRYIAAAILIYYKCIFENNTKAPKIAQTLYSIN